MKLLLSNSVLDFMQEDINTLLDYDKEDLINSIGESVAPHMGIVYMDELLHDKDLKGLIAFRDDDTYYIDALHSNGTFPFEFEDME